jgi:hypothetical protein
LIAGITNRGHNSKRVREYSTKDWVMLSNEVLVKFPSEETRQAVVSLMEKMEQPEGSR